MRRHFKIGIITGIIVSILMLVKKSLEFGNLDTTDITQCLATGAWIGVITGFIFRINFFRKSNENK
jgi:hypothetical protein